MNPLRIIFCVLAIITPTALLAQTRVTIIHDNAPGIAASHGLDELQAALKEKGIAVGDASSEFTIVAGLATGPGPAASLCAAWNTPVAQSPESLVIHTGDNNGKKTLLLAASDDRGLMYALLDAANRLRWSTDPAHPFSEIHDTSESPSVKDRALTIYTFHPQVFGKYLFNEDYWTTYFDLLAKDRFNSLELIFGYETGGYFAPAYPYFFDVNGYPDVQVVGQSKDQQTKNLAALKRLISLAHARGLRVTIGLWDHIYRGGVQGPKADKPTPGLVWGVTPENLVPFTVTAYEQFLKVFPEIDGVQFRMHEESGLKADEIKGFWHQMFQVCKRHPEVLVDCRLKGYADDLINEALDLGLNQRLITKYWAEHLALPFQPTHVQEWNQFDRRHSYADVLRYPKRARMLWQIWSGGTIRVLQWGDPDWVKRFMNEIHFYDGEGFDLNEPMATKMQSMPHDQPAFDLLTDKYRYTKYEFQRWWHFYELFGRLGYNPATPSELWDREFQSRLGKDAGPIVEAALHRASQILPRVEAYCMPQDDFAMTRGSSEKQRKKDLAEYCHATPSDIEQFQSIAEFADNILVGNDSPKISPLQTAHWFAQAQADVLASIANAEKLGPAAPGTELFSTLVDLKILAHLAGYHSHRAPAGVSYALFERSHDLNQLDDALAEEKLAIDEWQQIVDSAADVYAPDMMMGRPTVGLSGHWKDELVLLQKDMAHLESQRAAFQPGHESATPAVTVLDTGVRDGETTEIAQRDAPGRQIIRDPVSHDPSVRRFDFRDADPPQGFEHHRKQAVVMIAVPNGSYELKFSFDADAKSYGPMWIEAGGINYSNTFTVPPGQSAQKTLNTTVVDGKLEIVFRAETSARWNVSTMEIHPTGPKIANVPVHKSAPDSEIPIRATVWSTLPLANVHLTYGTPESGFTTTKMDPADKGLYRASIPASSARPGLRYWIEAADAAGQRTSSPPAVVIISSDIQPPEVRHAPLTHTPANKPLTISAQITDPSGVKSVRLRYRSVTQFQDFRTLHMLPTGQDNTYRATIPPDQIPPTWDLMYYIEATDQAGNSHIHPNLETQTPYIVVHLDR